MEEGKEDELLVFAPTTRLLLPIRNGLGRAGSSNIEQGAGLLKNDTQSGSHGEAPNGWKM